MKEVTIRRCPSCETIRGHTDDVVAALKDDPDVKVNVVDGGKGEFNVSVDGKEFSKSGESMPDVSEIVTTARGGVPAGV